MSTPKSKPRYLVALVLSCLAGILVSCCFGGCSSPRAVQPTYNSNAGATAISTYDTDGDGLLGTEELEKVPALRASLDEVDSNGDAKISAEEIDARIAFWRTTQTAEMPVTCRVLQAGDPVASAKIEFTPEPFLGSEVPPASGMTDSEGTATLSMPAEHLADKDYPGVTCGWYQVRITSEAATIPAKYNSQTTLGCEVSPGAGWVYEPGELVFELTK